jgi:hypothetical protein
MLNNLERFGQAVIDTTKLISVTYRHAEGSTNAYGVATFEGGLTINSPASEARSIIEALPNKTLTEHYHFSLRSWRFTGSGRRSETVKM